MSSDIDNLAYTVQTILNDFIQGRLIVQVSTGVSGAKRIEVVRK